MKISKLSWAVGIAGAIALGLSPVLSERAQAFGGFWSSQSTPIKQSAEKILFVDNGDATLTAVVQIDYAGPAQSFAWLIPVPGTPTVSVASSVVFQRLVAATEPEYWLERSTQGMCMASDASDAGVDAGPAIGIDTSTVSLQTMEQGSVGPYDYVTIKASAAQSDPVQAATDWLSMNGYDLTGVDSKVLAPYLKAGMNLLAFKLKSGMDAGAIRPVTLTYKSTSPMIPIRPSAVAAQDDMSMLVWVIGPSQAVPSNYRSLVLDDAAIDWLGGGTFVTGTLPAGGAGPFGNHVDKPGNYDALVSLATHEAGGQGFVTELAGPASQYRDRVWSDLDAENYTGFSTQTYADGIDAIIAAGSLYGGWDGLRDAVQSATTLPSDVTFDAFADNPDLYRGAAQVDTAKFLSLVNDNVVKPVSDTAALLNNGPYLTRFYSRMNASEMTLDPTFDFNFDLAQINNVHVGKQNIACSTVLNQSDAPWHIVLPQGGVLSGKGSEWPIAVGAIPANLKIVALSSSGSGNVVKDNSATIGAALFKSAGTSDAGVAIPTPTQNGASIGGTQSVTAFDNAKSSDGSGCSVSRVGSLTGTGGALAWPLAGLFFALRKRRLANCDALRRLRKAFRSS